MTFIKKQSILTSCKSKLHDLGFKYGTDKCWIHEDSKSYLVHYEEVMKNNRNNIRLLEIGVRDGSSLLTFNEYFNNSKIIGIDIDNNCNKLLDYNNIDVIIGDATDEKILLNAQLNEQLDYIIDDGSHYANDIIKCLDMYIPLLKIGGKYIIEDLDTSKRISSESSYNNLENKLKKYTINNYPRMVIIHI